MPLPAAFAGLLLTAALVALPATPAAAHGADLAAITVDAVAERNILPPWQAWSRIEAFVSNTGAAPAADVTVTVSLPTGLRATAFESTSDWDCDWLTPVVTCIRVGDFPPGLHDRALAISVNPESQAPGAVLTTTAAVSTSTPEDSTADNSDTQDIRIVPTGSITVKAWNDLNADGVRQPTEPASGSHGVSVNSVDDNDGYGVGNMFGGMWQETVPAKRYRVTEGLPRNNWRFTVPGADSAMTVTGGNNGYQYGDAGIVTVDPATPVVLQYGVVAVFRPTAVTPASAPAGGTVDVILTGERFRTTLLVQLTRPGHPSIEGTITEMSADRGQLHVSFPLAGAAPGSWTLTLDAQMGPHAEVADAFTVL